MSLTIEDLKKLKEPFDAKTICVKVQSLSKNKDKAGLVCYVQHTDAYNRIDEVDPAWSSEITGVEIHPATEKSNPYFNVRVKLTINGVSRENTGEGDDMKSATSDAIKRTGMLFGIGRYLYDTETVWVPYDQNKDYYKIFTLDEYHAALRPGQVRVPVQAGQQNQPPAQNPSINPRGQSAVRMAPPPSEGVVPKSGVIKPSGSSSEKSEKYALANEIFAAGRKVGKNTEELNAYIGDQCGVSLKNMTVEEMKHLLSELNRQYEGN